MRSPIAWRPIARRASIPMAEGIAVEGMRLVKESLPVAVRDGKNLVARAKMMAAASMGATAFQKGLGAIHSLEPSRGRPLRHPSRAHQRRGHALCAGVQPPGHRAKMTRLAAWLGLPNPSFKAVMDWVLALRKEIGIPHTLKDIGVGRDRIDELVGDGGGRSHGRRQSASHRRAGTEADVHRQHRRPLAQRPDCKRRSSLPAGRLGPELQEESVPSGMQNSVGEAAARAWR